MLSWGVKPTAVDVLAQHIKPLMICSWSTAGLHVLSLQPIASTSHSWTSISDEMTLCWLFFSRIPQSFKRCIFYPSYLFYFELYIPFFDKKRVGSEERVSLINSQWNWDEGVFNNPEVHPRHLHFCCATGGCAARQDAPTRSQTRDRPVMGPW